MHDTLMLRAHRALRTPEPDAKCAAVHALRSDWLAQRLDLDRRTEVAPIGAPGRPARPLLVSPLEVGRRSVRTVEGRAALIHALAHIEFNAMNLGLDALYRFRDMPVAYYDDWVTVSCEEAHHFALLRDHLRALGYDYGDFSAHDGLWEMAVKTAHDALTRMALVPRVLEARGLDASPALIRKLDGVGDRRAVEILEIILRDEIGHVRVGNRWYAYLCAQRGLDPLATFRGLLAEYGCPRLRPPLNLEARGRAGFSADELAWLAECAHERVSPSR